MVFIEFNLMKTAAELYSTILKTERHYAFISSGYVSKNSCEWIRTHACTNAANLMTYPKVYDVLSFVFNYDMDYGSFNTGCLLGCFDWELNSRAVLVH